MYYNRIISIKMWENYGIRLIFYFKKGGDNSQLIKEKKRMTTGKLTLFFMKMNFLNKRCLNFNLMYF